MQLVHVAREHGGCECLVRARARVRVWVRARARAGVRVRVRARVGVRVAVSALWFTVLSPRCGKFKARVG